MEQTETGAGQENEKTRLHAKTLSKIMKIAAVAGLVACSVLKWLGFMPGATVGEVCMVWATVYGLGAGTIDLNLIIDKFTGGGQ
ncbi:MAG TPA: hypothetical protein DCZ74_03215 [Treponema sp.]|nr:hypothetical protein [Treponema sp.]